MVGFLGSFAGKTVILADGDFPSSPLALDILARAKRVVSCDRAAAGLVSHGFPFPDWVVGDLDSIPGEIRKEAEARSILVHDPNQEDNDLSKAFNYAVMQGWSDIVILGATGRREDHTLGNIAYLADFCKRVPQISMVTDYGIFSALNVPGGVVETKKGMQISFFSFDPQQKLTAKGVVYPVEDLTLPRWHRATLNEARGECVTLSFVGEPVLVYRAL